MTIYDNPIYAASFILLWIISSVLFLPGDQKLREGRDLALFIAIDDYENWEDLRNPIRDVEEIAGELFENFGFDTVILRNPTEREIYEKLNEYVRSDYRPDDQLLIFFSGHGHLIRTSREGFIIPREAMSVTDDPFGSSFISHDRLRNIVASIPCRHVLLILDSCFSGTFDERIVRGAADSTGIKGVKRLNPEDFENRTLFYLTAGGDEYVDDGSDHSPFARAFLLALRNFGDINNDGIINFLELSAYIQNSVKGQKPTAGDFEEHEGGDFYLVRSDRDIPETPGAEKGERERGYREVTYTTTAFTSIGDLTLSPDWSPDGEWIVYASNVRGDMDIWKKESGGGRAVRLTKMPGNETHPAWSPDGRYIAFASDQPGGGLMIMDAGGSEVEQVAPFGGTPHWSHDGRQLVFESNGNVYRVLAEGGEPVLLVRGTSANPHPVWSGNGLYILYWHRTLGDIYRLNLRSGESTPMRLVPSGQEVGSLGFSREGDRLLFSRGSFGGSKNLYGVVVDTASYEPTGTPYLLSASATDDVEGAFSPGCECIAFTARNVERHLYAVPLDEETGLQNGKPEVLTRHGRLNYYPAISPDGQAMVWTSHRSGEGNLYTRKLLNIEAEALKVTTEWDPGTREISGSFDKDGEQFFYSSTLGGVYQIWKVPAIGEEGRTITDNRHPNRDVHPRLSPDGQLLVFYSNRLGSWDLWTLSVEPDSAPQRLTDWPGNELYPAWSPDGRRIAFHSDRNGNADIWVMDIETGKTELLVSHPAEESWCGWSPDGGWFYFVSNRGGRHNIWRIPAGGGEPEAVTDFDDLNFGLPENGLYTQFAFSGNRLVLPLEERKGDIYLLKEE